MQSSVRTTKEKEVSDGQIPREKFDDGVTSGDANFSKDNKTGASYFLECDSDAEKYFSDEIGEFSISDEGEVEKNLNKPTFYPNFTTEPELEHNSDLCSDSDSDSTLSLEYMNFGDDEDKIQVDRLIFYKHQENMTRKTWTVFRPETKRLAYVPFHVNQNGKSSLANISTKLLFVKQPYFEHSIYLSFLSIHNESDNFTSYMVIKSLK